MKGLSTILGLGLCSCWAFAACGDDAGGGQSASGASGGMGASGGDAGAHQNEAGRSQEGGGSGVAGGSGGESTSGGEATSPGGDGGTPPEGGAANGGSDDVGGAPGGDAGANGTGGAGSPSVGPNVVFATALVWAPQSLGGLAGADAKCQASAENGGLAGTYVAWLSDATHDAKTRLGSARGWVRTDGKPFADTVADITTGKHYYVPNVDEHGARVNLLSSAVTTGTQANGTKSAAAGYCSDYTATDAVGVTRGNLNRYDDRWTAVTTPGDVQACNAPAHLYCFQIDHQEPAPAAFPASRKVFVSKGAPRNDMGIANFDTTCATEATDAGLTGTYKALVSTTAQAASARFNLSGATFARADGAPVVNAAADLASATSLLEPIDLNADGTEMSPGNRIVFTGATAPNQKGTNAETCDNWTKSVFDKAARIGQPTSKDAAWWVYANDWHCNTWLHVYCVQE